MDMKPDEIVVRYRQAKNKAEQLKILADLNACSVDDIIKVICDNSEYKPNFFNKAKIKLKEEADKIPYKKPEIEEINRQQYKLDMRKAEIYQKISNALDVLKGW